MSTRRESRGAQGVRRDDVEKEAERLSEGPLRTVPCQACEGVFSPCFPGLSTWRCCRCGTVRSREEIMVECERRARKQEADRR